MTDIRSFICIELSAAVEHQLTVLQDTLKTAAQGVRWVKPGNIHLTLKFLGDVRQEQVPMIEQALQSIVSETACFAFSLQGLGAFPNLRQPRIIWVGVDNPGGELAVLAGNIDVAMTTLGFAAEKRAFRPHLTLGRVKTKMEKRFLLKLSNMSFATEEVPVSEIVLMKSDLKQGGAVYTSLAKFKTN